MQSLRKINIQNYELFGESSKKKMLGIIRITTKFIYRIITR